MILGIPKPVCIAFAANGARRSKVDHLALPIGAGELVEAAIAAMASGASLFSFSVRDDKGRVSSDPVKHAQVVEALRNATQGQVVLQLELDTEHGASDNDVNAILDEAKPDCCQIKLGQILPRDGDEKDEAAARHLLAGCEASGIGVQIVLDDPTDIDWYYAFRQYGIIPESCSSVLFVLGQDGEVPASKPHVLRGFLAGMERQNLFGKISWSVAAFGPQEMSALTAAMALGGHIAPGFAYNVHSVEGEKFASPNDQLTVLGEIADRLGRPTASAFEARTLLFGTR